MNRFFILVALSCLIAKSAFGAESAEKLYQKEKYSQALELFLKKQVKNPNDRTTEYNLGNTQYRLKNYDAAAKAYNDVTVSGRKDLAPNALYNLGNAAFQQGKLEEAAGYYQRTLELAPNDEDAKYNLEFVRQEIKRREEESKKPKDQKNQEQKSDEQQKSQPSPGGQKDQQENQKDKQGTNQDQKPQQNNADQGEQKQQEQNQAQQQPNPGSSPQEGQAQKISKEDAERLLNSMDENRPKAKAKAQAQARGSRVPGGKPW